MALLWIIDFDKGIKVTKVAHHNEEEVKFLYISLLNYKKEMNSPSY